MNWNTQTNNQGNSVKLIVFFYPGQPETSKTYHAFAGEEKRGIAIAGLTRRILQSKVLGLYQTAIFYKDGVEVEKWVDGYKVKKPDQ